MILAGDIGGTNARVALVALDKKTGATKTLRHETFPSEEHRSLESVIRAFLGKKPPKIKAACFGVAGPVIDGKCVATNLPWVVDARAVGKKLGIPRFALLNDLVALAMGAVAAPSRKLKLVHGRALPKKKGANIAVIAAGTGLGEAALVWEGTRFVALGTEGGHTDFAPRNDLEIELLRFLKTRHAHVSYERVLSGPGIGALYDFFREAKGVAESDAVGDRIAKAEDRNAEISRAGAAGDSKAASQALDVFVSLYGAEAGNLALKTLATGGVYVAGAIAGHLLERLASPLFSDAFTAKGRFSPLVASIPVAVVLDSDIGLSGSTRHAVSLL